MSHTVKIAVEIRDRAAFCAAVIAAGGSVVGEGTHQLYETRETGLAVRLPGWTYPIVITDAGLRCDDYGGRWGDRATLDRIVERYAIAAARAAAEAQGWYCEETAAGLAMYLPDGGVVTVSADGTIDVACVDGQSCVDIAAPIEMALGRAGDRAVKPEYYIERAHVRARGET